MLDLKEDTGGRGIQNKSEGAVDFSNASRLFCSFDKQTVLT